MRRFLILSLLVGACGGEKEFTGGRGDGAVQADAPRALDGPATMADGRSAELFPDGGSVDALRPDVGAPSDAPSAPGPGPRRWRLASKQPNFARAVGGTGEDDVWVTADGTAHHSTGDGTWRSRPPMVAAQLNGIWGTAPDNVYFSAYINALLRWDGSKFVKWGFPSATVFQDVWGSGPTDVYAVGTEVYRSGGDGTWRIEPVSRDDVGRYASVWGSSAADVWIVATSGSVYRSQPNGTWKRESSGAPSPILRVWGTGRGEVFILSGGALTRTTGDGKWQNVPLPEKFADEGLWSMSGSGPDDVNVGTTRGRVYRRTSDGVWRPEFVDPSLRQTLSSVTVWSPSPRRIHAVTVNGVYVGEPAP